jgi:small subunit ribosomal protein S17
MTDIKKMSRILKGKVVSNKMAKSIVVRVDRLTNKTKYLKYQKSHTKFTAHDETNEAQIGDTVLIKEVRPMSKTKRWMLESIVAKGPEPTEKIDE